MSFSIDTLRLRNFVTYQSQDLPLYDQGLVLIKGDNRDEPQKGGNSTGKTIFGDSMWWLLSGNTSRDILANSVVGKFGRSCSVSADVRVNDASFVVTRFRKDPQHGNSLQLLQKGDVSHRRIKDTEERLQQIIGCSLPLLRLSCFQYGDITQHFSRLRSDQRAKILDEIVGATEADIPERQRQVNSEIKKIENKLYELSINSSSVRAAIEADTKDIAQQQSMLDNSKKIMDTRANEMREEITRLLAVDVLKIEESIAADRILLQKEKDKAIEINNLKRKLDELKEQEIEIQKQLAVCAHVAGSIPNSVEASAGGVCENCGNVITDASLSALKADWHTRRKVAEGNYSCVKAKLAPIKTEQTKIIAAITDIQEKDCSAEIEKRIRNAEFERTNAIRDKEKAGKLKVELQKYTTEYATINDGLQTRVQDLKDRILKHQRTLDANYFQQWKLNYRFEILQSLSLFYSPSGFRPLIMEHYAPILSDCANYFFKDFTDGRGEIRIDSKSMLASGKVIDKVEIGVSENGVIKSFPAEWSAGEGGCVDICLNSGIMRLATMKAAKEFNFLFLDEITNSLSPKWISRLIAILREKYLSAGKSIFITSHNYVSEKEVDQVWTVRKEKGISTIITGQKGD